MGQATAGLGEGMPLPPFLPRTREILTVESVLAGLGVVGIVEEPVRAETGADPGEGWWRGRLFPNDCSARAQSYPWRHEASPMFGMRVRHMPGRRTLMLAESHLGERAKPLLAEWRVLWEGCDVDRLDVELRVAAEARRMEYARVNRVAGASALERGDLAEAATLAADDEGMEAPKAPPVRHAALHIVEDAAVQVALSRSGVPFVFEATERGDSPARFAPAPGGRLRRLMPEEPAYGEAAEAMAQSCGGAQPYWRSPAFRERAGRPMAVAGSIVQARAILVDMARQGHGFAFVKACAQKGGTWSVDLVGAFDVDEALARLVTATAADFLDVQFGGALLIQGHVPFLREHRFLVVSHRVVASTASVRSLSVLDALPSRILHPFTAELARPAGGHGPYDRGESVARPDRDLVARMAWGARDLARAMSREPGLPDAYTIDMGLTACGDVLPIEVNGLAMAGLYAAHYPRVAAALARRHARMAPHPGAAPAQACAAGPSPEDGESPRRSAAERAARMRARDVMGQGWSPERDRFVGEHASEVSAYLAREFPHRSRAAMREAFAAFDPARHDGWRERYDAWLGRVFLEGAVEASAAFAREARPGEPLVGYAGVHGSHWFAIDASPPARDTSHVGSTDGAPGRTRTSSKPARRTASCYKSRWARATSTSA